MTDHEDKVLHNLRDCVAANSHVAPGGCAAALPAASVAANTIDTAAEMHDPEDAETCDDLDDFFAGDPAQGSASQIPRDTSSWNIVSTPSVATSRGHHHTLLHAKVQAAWDCVNSVPLQGVQQMCQI